MELSHVPMVGMVVTISPNFSLYRMVVLPAASRPTYDITVSPRSPYNFTMQKSTINIPVGRRESLSDSERLVKQVAKLTHLLLAEETGEKLRDRETHIFK